MEIEQVLPHVLECVDQTRLGPRKVDLLKLVYHRQAGQRCSVHLGPAELGLYGRSRHQVGYDRRALDELVRMGMLRKVPGRGRIANGYSLREPRLWDSKRIHWLAPRERVISFFWRLLPRDAILLSRDAAGQSVVLLVGGEPQLGFLSREAPGHAPSDRAATEFHRATSSGSPLRIDGAHRATSSDAAPRSSLSSLESEFTPSLSPPQGVRECPETQQAPPGQDEGRRLLDAVRATVQTDVIGINADRIRGVGRSNPALIEWLVAHAHTLKWVKTGTGAADAVEAELAKLLHKPQVVEPHRDPEWLRRRLDVLRAQLHGFEHDDELLAPHLDQIEELEARLSAVTGEVAS